MKEKILQTIVVAKVCRLGPLPQALLWVLLVRNKSADGGKHGVFAQLNPTTTHAHKWQISPRTDLPSIQQTTALIITTVAITVSLEVVGLAVVAHRGRHNRKRTHQCDDRAAFDMIVNMGLTTMILAHMYGSQWQPNPDANGNRHQ